MNGVESTHRLSGKPPRVVMAVNNPATMDYRVVKSAEALARAGYDCHVVGTLKDGFSRREKQNGVTYHRVPLRTDLQCLSAGLWPWRVTRSSQVAKSKTPVDTKPKPIWSPLRALHVCIKAVVVFCAFLISLSAQQLLLLLAYVLLFPIILLVGVWSTLSRSVLRTRAALKPTATSSSAETGSEATDTDKSHEGLEFADFSFVAKLFNALGKRIRHAPARLGTRSRQLVRKSVISPLIRSRHLAPQKSPLGVRFLQGRYLNSFYATLTRLRGDVYHAHELYMLESCALAAAASNARLVYDSHELEAHRNPPLPPAAQRTRLLYESSYIPQTSAVIAVSDGCARSIKEAYSLEKVEVIRNAPVLATLEHPPATLRERLGLGPDVPLIVYTGSVTINRGLEKVVEALQLLPDYALATVGPWNTQVREQLDRLTAELGVQDRFFMHEKVPPQHLIEFIRSGSLAVLPIQNACLSYYYCLPNKLFEAMFAGLPVVVSDFPDMGDFVKNHEIGVTCDERDPHSIAEAIRTAYENPDRYYTDAKINDLRAVHCFENESNNLVALYERITRSEKDNAVRSKETVTPTH